MYRITLDTNCLLYWLEERPPWGEKVHKLLELGRRNGVTFFRSTRVLNVDGTDVPEKFREQFQKLEIVMANEGIEETPSVFRLDVSRFGDGDELGSVNRRPAFIAIFGEEPVSAGETKNRSNVIADYDALYAHWIKDYDLFVTEDKARPFNSKNRDRARDELGLRIVSLDEALSVLMERDASDGSS